MDTQANSNIQYVKNDLNEIGGKKIYHAFLAMLWKPVKAPAELLNIFKRNDV